MAQSNSRFLETVVERLMERSSGWGGGICVSFVSMKKGKTQGTQNFKFNALLGNSFLFLDDYKTGPKSKIFYEAANRWVKKLLYREAADTVGSAEYWSNPDIFQKHFHYPLYC